MELSELQSLIEIRAYVNNSINSYSLEKEKLNELRSMLTMIDVKLVNLLLSNEFKEYINFKDAKEEIMKIAKLNSLAYSREQTLANKK